MAQMTLVPDFRFAEQVEGAGPFQLTACFQCRKCTNGCPASFAMDMYPDEVIRMAILGQKDRVLRSRTIWVCASCETCSTRCPNGVKIAELMDHFKEMAVREGIAVPQPQVLGLHRAFLDNIKYLGRIFEGALLPMYFVRSGQIVEKIQKGTWREEMELGWSLWQKGRLPVLPKTIKGRQEVRAIIRSSNKQVGTSC